MAHGVQFSIGMPSRNVHDALIQRAFESPSEIEGFLRAVLPSSISRSIRPGSLTLEHARQTDDDLHSLLPDFLCRAEVDGTEMLLGVIIEHQSKPDARMPLRMLGAIVGLWQRHVRQPAGERGGLRLPPVLPIVIFHGKRPWTGRTNTLAMVELPAELRPKYVRYQPRSEFVLVDLSNVPDEVFVGAAMTTFARLAMLLLKHGRGNELPARIAELHNLWSELNRAPQGWDAIMALVSYVSEVDKKMTTGKLSRALAPGLGEEKSREVAMTLAERLRSEGEKKGVERGKILGRQEGMQEGRQEGRQEGMQEGRQEGMQEGRQRALREAARRMLARGMSMAEIAEMLGASPEEVRAVIGAEP